MTSAIGGMRVASAMLKPAVVSFLDTMLYESGEPLRVEEATISDTSPIKYKTLAESNIVERTGLMVGAIREKQTGKYIYHPEGSYKLNGGDTLIVIGDLEQMKNLRTITEG
ncbi:MAG: TrkA C-terminal domain-containing protein [Elusimicrobiota bacterium]|nr:TrkA C-terminal domain-containing protein [Elusimicrobiota bacterium]